MFYYKNWDGKQTSECRSRVGDKNRNFISRHSYRLAGEISSRSAPIAILGLIPSSWPQTPSWLAYLCYLAFWVSRSELWREQQIRTGLLFLPYFMSHLDFLPCYVLHCLDPWISLVKTFWVLILACSTTELCFRISHTPTPELCFSKLCILI